MIYVLSFRTVTEVGFEILHLWVGICIKYWLAILQCTSFSCYNKFQVIIPRRRHHLSAGYSTCQWKSAPSQIAAHKSINGKPKLLTKPKPKPKPKPTPTSSCTAIQFQRTATVVIVILARPRPGSSSLRRAQVRVGRAGILCFGQRRWRTLRPQCGENPDVCFSWKTQQCCCRNDDLEMQQTIRAQWERGRERGEWGGRVSAKSRLLTHRGHMG